ncbi:MAG: outer membrane protein assembly factor BamD, partial [Magnetococcales bacterium]|nr:outer membrane protein assembly factor BamD [Magnetococcales bacterium]
MIRYTLAILLLFLGGCASSDIDERPDLPPETLYLEGMEALRLEKYAAAAERFEEVDRKHPFSPWATRAQVNLIFAHYRKENYLEALSAAERFIRLHPRHAYASYAFYMRGLIHYRQISSAYQDQSRTREALQAFEEVVSRFPKSDYAWEAERMLTLCRDRLAEQEMVVGRYYLDREDYIAAINRFTTVVKTPIYRVTPYAEEALFSMVLASLKLGLDEDARN